MLSHNQNGIEIQTDCAIIAGLMIALWISRRPTKRTHEMLCYVMQGWATTDELDAHLAKLKRADEQAAKKTDRLTPLDCPPPTATQTRPNANIDNQSNTNAEQCWTTSISVGRDS